MKTPREILREYNIPYIETKKGTYTTTCRNCNGGYLNVKIERTGVVWFCHSCQQGGGADYEQRESSSEGLGPIKAVFDYTNEAGGRLFQVLKFEPLNAPKKFRQRKDPDQKKWSIKGVRRVLYRLPELIEAVARELTVFLVEGEKDVETLRKHGVVATTKAMGAVTEDNQEKGTGWIPEYSETLRGADVVLIPDNDDQGREHVRIVARCLHGVVARLRMLDLATVWPDIEESDDVSAWFEAGGTVERLWEIVESLSDWQPESGGNGEAPPWDDIGNGEAKSNEQQGAPRFPLVAFNQVQFGTKPVYLVKNVIPRTGIAIVWGPPKCGKSFWTFDLCMHIARDLEYRGHRVQKGPIVYCAFEGQEGFKARIEAYRREHGIDPGEAIPFFLSVSPARLVKDHRALIASIRAQIGATPPVAVTLDTLNRSIDGSESKDEDMGAYLGAADAIHLAFGCVVIIVHHCGINDSRPRGHTSLTGTTVAQLAVRRNNGLIVVEVEYMKDGPAGTRFASKLKVVDLGVDDDGDAVTSCVIEPVEDADISAGTSAGKNKSVTANQARFLDILVDAILDAPEPHRTTVDIPGGRTAISREWLKMRCLAKGWLDPGANENNSRAKVSNMINALAGKHRIGADRLYVWDAR